MNQKSISLILMGFFLISAVSPCLIQSSRLATVSEKQNTQVNEKVIQNDDNQIQANSNPQDAAYYTSLAASARQYFYALTSYTHLIINAVTQDNTYYYITGQCMDGTSVWHLFVQKIAKSNYATFAITVFTLAPATNSTGGLSICKVGSQIIVVGYQGIDPSNTHFTTYGIGLLCAYDSTLLTLQYFRTFGMNNDSSGDGGYLAPNWGFGGERLESVIALTNGSIVVGGAIYYNNQTYEGNPYGSEMAYVAIVNPVNGAIVNAYQTIYSPPGGDYYASVVKKLYVDPTNQTLYCLCWGKDQDVNSQMEYFSYFMAFTLSSFSMSYDNWLTHGLISEFIPSPGLNTFSTANDMTFDNSLTIYVAGTAVISGQPTNQIICQVDPSTGYESQIYNLPSYNQTAEFIGVDANNTFYLTGLAYTNTSSSAGVVSNVIDLSQNNFIINSTIYNDPTPYSSSLRVGVFNNVTRSWQIFGTASNTTGSAGYFQNFATSTYLPTEILTALSTITNTPYVFLTWTNVHHELRYFNVYRYTSPIISGNLNSATLLTSTPLISQYYYNDTIPIGDGVKMYYTIVGSSDNITGTTPAANVFTIYYAAPGSVIANFAPPIAINGSGVPFNISWTPVPNATLELYVSNQPISSSQFYHGITPIATNMGPSIKSITYSPPNCGLWYFVFNAYNLTRGNTTTTYTAWCQCIPQAPVLYGQLANPYGSDDGHVFLSWSNQTCNYYVFGSLNKNFTLADTYNATSGVLLINANQTDTGFELDGIGSGLWYFGILASNSTGNATQLSNIYTVTIARTPAQPTLVSLNGAGSSTGNISLSWTNEAPIATEYELYQMLANNSQESMTNYTDGQLAYIGIGTSFNETVLTNGNYYFAVIALNQNGFRSFDPSYIIEFSIDIGSNTPISQSILIMVITAAAVVGVVVIVYVVYRRKNPAFGF